MSHKYNKTITVSVSNSNYTSNYKIKVLHPKLISRIANRTKATQVGDIITIYQKYKCTSIKEYADNKYIHFTFEVINNSL